MIGNDIEGLIFLEKSDNDQKTIQSYEKGLFISMYYYIQREILYHECQYHNILSFWYRDKIDWNKVGAIATIIGTILSGIGIILSITSNNQLNINVNLNMNKVHIENINE